MRAVVRWPGCACFRRITLMHRLGYLWTSVGNTDKIRENPHKHRSSSIPLVLLHRVLGPKTKAGVLPDTHVDVICGQILLRPKSAQLRAPRIERMAKNSRNASTQKTENRRVGLEPATSTHRAVTTFFCPTPRPDHMISFAVK